jgi:glycerophosphoryl diester phosphodiesterase
MPLDAIKRLDAGAWKGPQFAGEKVPTLREMLTRIAGRAISIIEIKAPKIVDAVVADVVATESLEHAVLFSFDADAVRRAHSINSEVATAFLVFGKTPASIQQIAQLVQRTQDLGAQAIAPNTTMVAPDLINAFHAAGLKVWVWTVNEPPEMQRFHQMGVNALITDRIDLLNAVLHSGR